MNIQPKVERQPLFKNQKRKFKDIKISTKITLFYLLFLLLSLIISNFLHQKIYATITAKKVSDVSFQMLHLINQNFNSIIDIVNGQSKVILANSDVQDLLCHRQDINDSEFLRKLNTSLYSYMDAVPVFTGIYLFDFAGNQYAVDKILLKTLNISDITKADWFPQVKQLKGAYLLQLNAGGIFWQQATEINYISLIRIINDLETQQPIGVLVINIPEKVIVNSFKEIGQKYHTEIAVFDEGYREIVNYHRHQIVNLPEILQRFDGKEVGSAVQKITGNDYLVSYMQLEQCNWKIVSIMAFSELSNELKIFNLIAFILIVINSLLLFIGSFFITRLITTPVQKLLGSMKLVEKGIFEEVNITTGNDEIGQLQNGYNIMIAEIQRLFERVVHEQKTKRKAELDVLQAQIKPHFLYNTFDAISSLALAGRNEDVYIIMKALGGYYRTSLSKGNEVITIAEEMELVKNYLTIQQYRYDDLFTVTYELDPEAGKYKILKLILQPLVENAIYHGIKPKGENGRIIISAKIKENQILLMVEDDGVGMDEAEFKRITMDLIPEDNASFGLRGTIERLRIFYGDEVDYQIETHKGCGTKIIITVPCKE